MKNSHQSPHFKAAVELAKNDKSRDLINKTGNDSLCTCRVAVLIKLYLLYSLHCDVSKIPCYQSHLQTLSHIFWYLPDCSCNIYLSMAELCETRVTCGIHRPCKFKEAGLCKPDWELIPEQATLERSIDQPLQAAKAQSFCKNLPCVKLATESSPHLLRRIESLQIIWGTSFAKRQMC